MEHQQTANIVAPSNRVQLAIVFHESGKCCHLFIFYKEISGHVAFGVIHNNAVKGATCTIWSIMSKVHRKNVMLPLTLT